MIKGPILETSQLQTLVAVTESGSFSKAAEELHVTQSAISQSVKNLEGRVSLKLFTRTGKKVVLTSEGEMLYRMSKDILLRMTDAVEEVQTHRNTMAGRISVGTLNGVGKSWLAHQMLEFSQKHPDVLVNVVLGFQEALLRDFEKNLIDFLVLPENAIPPYGEKVFLMHEKFVLIFPDHPRYKFTENVTLEELLGLPVILFEKEDPLFYEWCRVKFGVTPKKIKARFIINSHGMMLHAVAQGLGLAVVPAHVFKRSSQRNKVRTVENKFEVMGHKFYLIYRKESLDILRFKGLFEVLTRQGFPTL